MCLGAVTLDFLWVLVFFILNFCSCFSIYINSFFFFFLFSPFSSSLAQPFFYLNSLKLFTFLLSLYCSLTLILLPFSCVFCSFTESNDRSFTRCSPVWMFSIASLFFLIIRFMSVTTWYFVVQIRTLFSACFSFFFHSPSRSRVCMCGDVVLVLANTYTLLRCLKRFQFSTNISNVWHFSSCIYETKSIYSFLYIERQHHRNDSERKEFSSFSPHAYGNMICVKMAKAWFIRVDMIIESNPWYSTDFKTHYARVFNHIIAEYVIIMYSLNRKCDSWAMKLMKSTRWRIEKAETEDWRSTESQFNES